MVNVFHTLASIVLLGAGIASTYAHNGEVHNVPVDPEGSADAVNLFVRLSYFQDPSCSIFSNSQTRSLGVCQPSLDNSRGLLYQCVKAGTTVLQLSDRSLNCNNNNLGSSSSTVNTFSSSQCLFSSSAQRYVRISCDGTSVVTTITSGGGIMDSVEGGRLLRSNEEILL
jgi:hypothetical protein